MAAGRTLKNSCDNGRPAEQLSVDVASKIRFPRQRSSFEWFFGLVVVVVEHSHMIAVLVVSLILALQRDFVQQLTSKAFFYLVEIELAPNYGSVPHSRPLKQQRFTTYFLQRNYWKSRDFPKSAKPIHIFFHVLSKITVDK